MRYIYTLFLFFFSISSLRGQAILLNNPEILQETRSCLSDIYNFNFNSARQNLKTIESYSPDHPAIPFLHAFIIYWENYPLTPGHEKEDFFLNEMEKCIKISEEWVGKDPEQLEAIFFDLVSRAFYSMYWADNGKPGKVFPHLNRMYKHAMKGFQLQNTFSEFYFTSGLYNYYIEAYPEKHPSYKPVVMLFREGDRDLGLKQLKYCAEHALFLKAEARFFLSLLYINYEEDPRQASTQAAVLYREYPNNIFYAGKYLEFLLYDRKYFFAPVILDHFKTQKNDFAQMQYFLYHALLTEKTGGDIHTAKEEYLKALSLAGKFGEFTNTYSAIACMGLARIHTLNKNIASASGYFKRAKSYTKYNYILEDR